MPIKGNYEDELKRLMEAGQFTKPLCNAPGLARPALRLPLRKGHTMTTEEIRDIYGSEFLNELSLFIYDLTAKDIPAERMTKELIIWLEERGRCIALKSNIAALLGVRL